MTGRPEGVIMHNPSAIFQVISPLVAKGREQFIFRIGQLLQSPVEVGRGYVRDEPRHSFIM